MKVIVPAEVTASILTGSSIGEPDETLTPPEAVWDDEETYAEDDRVISVADHQVYQSLAGANLNNPLTDTDWWVRVQPTNRWAPYDGSISTVAICGAEAWWTLSFAQRIDAFAAFGLAGDSLELAATWATGSPGLPWSREVSLDGSIIQNWRDYWFGQRQQLRSLFMMDVPNFFGPNFTVTVHGDVIPGEVGAFAFGNQQWIGDLKHGSAQLGIRDLSRVEEDDFGNDILVPRRFRRNFDGLLLLPNTDIERVRRIFEALRTTPAAWIGVAGVDELSETTSVYGFVKEWSIEIAYKTHSLIRLRLEGLAQS